MRQEDILRILRQGGEMTTREIINVYLEDHPRDRAKGGSTGLAMRSLERYHIVQIVGTRINKGNGHPEFVWAIV